MSKILIFDFDGTLADTLSYSVNYAYEFNRKRKLLSKEKINFEEFRKMGLYDFVATLGIRKRDLFWFLFQIQRKMHKELKNISTFKGLPGILEELSSRNIKMGIATSNSKRNVLKFLEKNNLNYFDFIYSTVNYLGKDKLLKKAIKKCKANKDDVIYIGDEIRDINAARSSGVKIASVAWGYNLESVLSSNNPDYIIYQPKDLLKLLD
ncbi:HAD-IA family hydrolase [candidate division WWE3 bacterium]|uniref:HAD-IA family hydrolase n=1 Tax=candidate division WWE3 bacterium TaxID=2053526 RepID=A0A7X9HT24_UNCKA|nr:HAD-IA family hydrolase [candidate division WWE3 bacterium]